MAASVREALAWEAETGTAFLFVPVLFGAGILAYAHLESERRRWRCARGSRFVLAC
ncbi:MAG: hypothetical protein H6891_01735 [Brucellaceae bacterium]|nr:hypothetical protein [Brucellaceae bacterium]